ncbi:hypothetical protein SbBS512_E2635 [Shigella boydii CDC 3083-94]|uniref:Uncharacterized protein n=1 Tax=Shigella boydii serotype 18 (strain CDC 3083-94 / BS512) TaxID=344609 RepID=B2TW42_SHIB3|nr:hypothetical protein SbBS512_E2635 [Shigella boydii CDC 3083-94]
MGIIQRHYCLSCAIKPGFCGKSSAADDALMVSVQQEPY